MLNRTCKLFVTVIAFGALNLAVHSSSQAGVIQFSAPLVTANDVGVPPVPSSVSITGGTATAISGFASLAGVPPSAITFDLSNLALNSASASFDPSTQIASLPYTGGVLEVLLSGTPAAEFSNFAVTAEANFTSALNGKHPNHSDRRGIFKRCLQYSVLQRGGSNRRGSHYRYQYIQCLHTNISRNDRGYRSIGRPRAVHDAAARPQSCRSGRLRLAAEGEGVVKYCDRCITSARVEVVNLEATR